MVVPNRLRPSTSPAERRSADRLRGLESLERRQVMTASVGIDAKGVLSIVGTSGNDMVEVGYVEAANVVDGVLQTSTDTASIAVRIQSDTGAELISKTFPAASVASVKYAGDGGNDYLANITTKTTAWSTTTGGSVSTSLMVGSPGYRVAGAANEVGVFRVGPTGQVGVDFLYRGAGYAGQLAIFSLKGMDAYKPGSVEYIREACRRALSQSSQGHVVIKVAEQAAKFSGAVPWEGNFNRGTYKGVQTVVMDPGDTFAAMIIPNGTVNNVASLTTYPSDQRPLFSVPAANPYPAGAQFLGQAGDLTGQGSVFAFEDLRLDGSSDRDYNDIVFQVTGARGQATPVTEVTNASRNMAATTIFQQQINPYAATQQRADDVAMAAALVKGGFVVDASGKVSITATGAAQPGEVAIFSLQGMAYLAPGSQEFVREAARRALTGSTLGHIVASDRFDAGGRGPRGMTPGDTFGILSVDNGSIWGLFTGATAATTARLSVPGVADNGAAIQVAPSSSGAGNVTAISYTTLPDAPGGVKGTFGWDVAGARIVGNSSDSAGVAHGFIYDGTSYTTLDVPGATRGTNARSVSGNVVVGQYYTTRDTAYVSNGFAYDTATKTYVTINHPQGAGGSYPMGIDGTKVVGYYNPNVASGKPDTGKAYGYVYDRATDTYTAINHPDAKTYTTPRGISGNMIVGFYNNASGSHGFTFDGTTYRTLDYPGITGKTYARGVSGSLVVGHFTDAANRNHGFLFDGTKYTLLQHPHAATNTFVTGIDGTTVVGYYTDAAGLNRAFKAQWTDLATGTPAPKWSLDLGGRQVAVSGASSANTTSLDAGLANLCTVVYLDAGNNGVVDPADPSLGGALVTLTGVDAAGRSFTRTVVSEADGCAEFVGVPSGIYRISATDPSGRTLEAGSQVGTHGGTALAGAVTSVLLRPGDDARAYAIGRIAPARLAGSVYHDRDADRVFDPSESGIAGVTVTLTGTDDRGAAVAITTKTGANGGYGFSRLRPGTYSVTETQPAGWRDGRESVGTFITQPHPLARNGATGNDVFSTIRLRPGDAGVGYNFGETASSAVRPSYTDERVFWGTSGKDVVEVRLGDKEHAVTINGVTQSIDASVATIVSFNGVGGDDSLMIFGVPGSERMTIAPNVSTLVANGFRLEANGVGDVTFVGGVGDRAYLYDTKGDDVFTADPTTAVVVGTKYRAAANNVERVYAYATAGGTDTAVLTGSAGDDSFIATPADARMIGTGYYNFVRGFDTVQGVAAAGGEDRAYLYDSAGDDTLAADPATARLSGRGFDLVASGFARVDAYATSGGYDRAALAGSAGDDRYYADPLGGQMIGAGFDNRAVGFEALVGTGGAGFDRAYLTGTQANDTLDASPTRARLTGPGLDVTAELFRWMSVSGGSCLGADVANLTDSAGDDVIETTATGIRLRGKDYSIRVDNFTLANAFGGVGTNRRKLEGAPFQVAVQGNWVS
jgi:hypothetical protein